MPIYATWEAALSMMSCFSFWQDQTQWTFLSPNVWSNISIQIVRIIVILAQEFVKKCYNLMKQTKCILAHVKQKKLQPIPPSTVGVTDAAIGISFNVHKTGVTRTWSKAKTHNWISAGNRCLILPSTSSIVWNFFVCVCNYCKMIEGSFLTFSNIMMFDIIHCPISYESK